MIFLPTRDMGYQEHFLRALQTGGGFFVIDGKGNRDMYEELRRIFELAKELAATVPAKPLALPAP